METSILLKVFIHYIDFNQREKWGWGLAIMDNEFMEKLFLHLCEILAEINKIGLYVVVQKYIKLNGNEKNECGGRIKSNITINPEDDDVVYKYFYKGLDIIVQGSEPLYLPIEMEYELQRITLRSEIDDVTLRMLHLIKRILIDFHEGKCNGDYFLSLSKYYISSKAYNKLYAIFLESGLIKEDELTNIEKEECVISEELTIVELEKCNKKLSIVSNDECLNECIDRNIEESRVLIAKYNDITIGVIAFKEKKKQLRTKEGTREILDYEVNDMAIDKLYKGKGIAKHLIWSVQCKLNEVCGNAVKLKIIEPGQTIISTLIYNKI